MNSLLRTIVRFTITTLLIAISTGCCIPHSATRAEIARFAQEKQTQFGELNRLWYEGTSGDYDYFKYIYRMFGHRCFKVQTGKVPIPSRFPRSDDSANWVAISDIEGFKFQTP